MHAGREPVVPQGESRFGVCGEGEVPAPDRNVSPPERDPELLILLERTQDELAEGGRVYLHSSAGLHRTAMVA